MDLGRIAFTGASGMLGRHFEEVLLANGVQAIGLSRLADGVASGWDLGNWKGDAELAKIFPSIDAIVHIGALVPKPGQAVDLPNLYDCNVRSCMNLGFWALKREIPMVFISGAIVYENPWGLKQHETSPLGRNEVGGEYGLSKLLAEDVLSRLRGEGLKLAILRPSSIYGTGLHANKLISKLLESASCGEAIRLTPPVNDRYGLIHARDVGLAILATLERSCWQTMNLCSHESPSLMQLAQACLDIAGSHEEVAVIGDNVDRAERHQFSLDTSRAEKLLDWRAGIDLMSGLDLMRRARFS